MTAVKIFSPDSLHLSAVRGSDINEREPQGEKLIHSQWILSS